MATVYTLTLFVTRDGTERLSAPEVPVASRIGAGDSMLAGIVLALARGDGMRDAVLLGLAAGSATVMTPGTPSRCPACATIGSRRARRT
jgi:6-phosphofructokinase 2